VLQLTQMYGELCYLPTCNYSLTAVYGKSATNVNKKQHAI